MLVCIAVFMFFSARALRKFRVYKLQESRLSQSSTQIKRRLLLEVLMNRITGHEMLNRCFAFNLSPNIHLDLKSVNRLLVLCLFMLILTIILIAVSSG